MAYSTDGINWTAVNNSAFGTSMIFGITYGNGKFVAVGYSGKIAYMIDEETTFHTRFGFTEKRITSAGTEYTLSDGKVLKLNNGGGVTWS
ncbi:MAG: hypothetical protein LBB72_04650 [Spirochaetaceae bacterium]|jgi:hypothetical protein|nr:hypothetical protein [Spirochaetaceae bacterium]